MRIIKIKFLIALIFDHNKLLVLVIELKNRFQRKGNSDYKLSDKKN